MIAKIRRPMLVQQYGNMNTQRAPVGDGSNTFVAGDLVQLAAGVLLLVPDTTAVATTQLVWGQTPDNSKLATDIPPVAFYGENHYCFDLTDAIVEMNITNGGTVAGKTAAGVGDATTNNGTVGPQLSAVTIGAKYGIRSDAVNYVGVQMLWVTETANGWVTVVGIAPNQSLADYNGRVLVKFPKANIQG
jgi:hypothetical protein